MQETYAAKSGENAIDPSFFNLVSQIAHVAVTYGLTFTAARFWGWPGIEIVGGLCILYAAVHEFFWDPLMENALTRGSDLEDFCFLVLGVAVAAGVYAI
jgi:hypothetical protein